MIRPVPARASPLVFIGATACGLLGATGSVSAQTASLSYADWRSRHFDAIEQADSAISGYAADPDHDGLPNLLEYGMGASPWIADAAGALSSPKISTVDGIGFLSLAFVRDTRTSEIKLTLETADELAGPWAALDPSLPANQISVEHDTPSAGLQRVTVKDNRPLAESPRRFLRLRGTWLRPAAAPTFAPPGGSYGTAQSITLASSTAGASIRYTLDGSVPTASTGFVYSGPFGIAADTTVNALAFGESLADSAVATTIYTLSTPGAQVPASPAYETSAIKGTADVADDTAVWLHPTVPEQSVIIGVSKSTTSGDGGLYAFNLTGTRQGGSSWSANVNWFSGTKRYNNVDIAHGFPAGAETWDIVCASNRTDRRLDVYRVLTDAAGAFAGLEAVGRIAIGTGFASGSDAPYGCALYHRRANGLFYALTSDKDGAVGQYLLQHDPAGTGTARITGTRVAFWDVTVGNTEVEGIVADDFLDVIYIAGETEAIYRYSTDADGVVQSGSRVTVDTAGGGRLTADIEGLTLYYASHGTGYLIASSQGSDQYAVYNRAFAAGAANSYVKNFTIGASGSIDRVTSTDGIMVTNRDLGGGFASGLFIAHDGDGNSPTNYKLVPWDSIARDGGVSLLIDPSFDPR